MTFLRFSCGPPQRTFRANPALFVIPRPSLLQDVAARGILEDGVLLAAERMLLDLLAGMLGQPGKPVSPPAPLMCRRVLAPFLCGGGRPAGLVDPVGAFTARRIDDAGDVAAGCQHVADIALEQLGDAPGGFPGDDVVLLGAD